MHCREVGKQRDVQVRILRTARRPHGPPPATTARLRGLTGRLLGAPPPPPPPPSPPSSRQDEGGLMTIAGFGSLLSGACIVGWMMQVYVAVSATAALASMGLAVGVDDGA